MQPAPGGIARGDRDFLEPVRARSRLLGRADWQDAARLALNAAPINVADYLRERLFGAEHIRSDDQRHPGRESRAAPRRLRGKRRPRPLLYFARQVGGEKADFGPGRLALRLRAADENLRGEQNARPARPAATGPA